MTSNSLFIPTPKNAKCAKCENYLSVFPIVISVDKENICGRCATLDEESVYVRNKAYEVIAEDIAFPCSNTAQGCFERLVPKKNAIHEKTCPFRLVDCPTSAFTKCGEKMSRVIVEKHCMEEHSDVVLKNGEFELDCTMKTVTKDCMLVYEKRFYPFSLKFNSGSKILKFSLHCVEMEDLCFKFKIKLKTQKQSFSVRCFGGSVPDVGRYEIDLGTLQVPCSYSNKIHGKISLGDTNSKEQLEMTHQKLLNLFKCSVCSKNLLPPIEMCFDDTIKCRLCASSTSIVIRSPKFDDLADLDYPCDFKSNGCPFISKPVLMKHHRQFCLYANTTCPIFEFEPCNWMGSIKEMEEHIQNNHGDKLMDSCDISEDVSVMGDFVKCYLYHFEKCYFTLIFGRKNNGYCWTLGMANGLKIQYNYEISILDNGEKKLVARQACLPIIAKNKPFMRRGEYCVFYEDQVTCFLADNTLTFKVQIFKSPV